MKRRTFLQVLGGAASAGALPLERLLAADLKSTDDIVARVAGLPRRVLGRTQRPVSLIVFPGLALMREDQESANRAVKQAFEQGVNYFDNAPAYGRDGECEKKMGPALQQLDRRQIFLACKTKARDKEGARAELERSLQRHQTDYFDLYQMHHLVTVEETKKALGPGGAIEAFLQAREEGKVKWFGFSAHSTQGALTALEGFNFDTAMFPISFADYYLREFGRAVIELAAQRGAAVVAIKPMSMGAWPQGVQRTRQWWYRTTETPEEIATALRFSLSLKGVVAGVPPSFIDLLDKAIVAARDYQPATAQDKDKLRKLAEQCEALFLREDTRAETARLDSDLPYPEHVQACFG